MAELKTRLDHLDGALIRGHLTMNTVLSSDTDRLWETGDRRTRLTLHAVDHVGRVVVRASTEYDGHWHEWLTFRHWEHRDITRVLEAVGFVPPEDEADECPAASVMTAEQLTEIREAARPGHIPERDRYRLAYESARRGRRSARALNRELTTSYETTLRIVQDERNEARRRITLARTTAAELHEFNNPDGDHLEGCPGCRIEAELNGGVR